MKVNEKNRHGQSRCQTQQYNGNSQGLVDAVVETGIYNPKKNYHNLYA